MVFFFQYCQYLFRCSTIFPVCSWFWFCYSIISIFQQYLSLFILKHYNDSGIYSYLYIRFEIKSARKYFFCIKNSDDDLDIGKNRPQNSELSEQNILYYILLWAEQGSKVSERGKKLAYQRFAYKFIFIANNFYMTIGPPDDLVNLENTHTAWPLGSRMFWLFVPFLQFGANNRSAP